MDCCWCWYRHWKFFKGNFSTPSCKVARQSCFDRCTEGEFIASFSPQPLVFVPNLRQFDRQYNVCVLHQRVVMVCQHVFEFGRGRLHLTPVSASSQSLNMCSITDQQTVPMPHSTVVCVAAASISSARKVVASGLLICSLYNNMQLVVDSRRTDRFGSTWQVTAEGRHCNSEAIIYLCNCILHARVGACLWEARTRIRVQLQ